MNNLTKISAAGSLLLAGAAAHAGIAAPNTSSTAGDVFLYGAIYNGATVVDGYFGDTQIGVDSVAHGTNPGPYLASGDSNLSTFLGEAAGGDTIVWSVIGGGFNSSAGSGAEFVTTTRSGAAPSATAGNLHTWLIGLNDSLGNITLTGPNSVHQTDLSTTTGLDYNPAGTSADASNWGGLSANYVSYVIPTGGSTSFGSSTLYKVTAGGFNGGSEAATAPEFTVSLSSTGLSYSAISAVPLPAAVWLLGSGLLGLAGVARRKIAA